MAEAELRDRFAGSVWLPGDPGYDVERVGAFGGLDPLPACVVEAAGADDVRQAVLAAREYDLPFAVLATGHGSLRPSDEGLLLRTTRMNQVLVDPERRTARVGPGATWRTVIEAAGAYGLVPLAGNALDVGVAGYTLGGGVGWLSRLYGYAADSLLTVEAVTADGEQVTVDARRRPELFWAMRGGSGNFAVATALELRLHPLVRGYGGTAYFPADRAADLLTRYRDWAPGRQPNELTTTIVLAAAAPYGDSTEPVVAVRAFHAGDPDDGRDALRALTSAAGEPVAGGFQSMTFLESETIGGTPPASFELLETLPDDAIEALLATAGRPGAPADSLELRYWGGATRDQADGQGPIGHRQVPFSVTVAGPADAATRLAPYATGGTFLNFCTDLGRTLDAYTTTNLVRLREIKRQYDPDNFFRLNHNIPPAAVAVTGR